MRKTFLYYLLIVLYLEISFHLVCFKSIDFFQVLLLFFSGIIFSTIFTFITSLTKKEKLNFVIFTIISLFLIIFFSAELVYFKIYDSFFNFNAIVFIGAIKDGSDKVLSTIWDNIVYIFLFFLPFILLFIKMPKKVQFLNKIDSLVMAGLFVLSVGYSLFFINFVSGLESYTYKQLFYEVNMPMLNVKSFGLLSSTNLSINRSLFGFTEKKHVSEDILTNRVTSLSGATKVKYNQSNINFNDLYNSESNQTIKDMHLYFSNQTPTEQNSFTGMFKDKNVIFILAESFDEIAIDKDLTPTLYKMKNEGIIFNNYFSPKYPASTADGEFMLEWGLLPVQGEDYSLIDLVYGVNPYLLPRVFKNNNYSTYVYHNYTGYYNLRKQYFSTLGFDKYRYCGEGITTRCENFHASDVDMINQSVDDFINQDKFYAYYITLSGHGSYDSTNFIATKNLYRLNGYNYSYGIKHYIAANIEFDLAMGALMSRLEAAGKLDDTVFVISSDHSPYYLSDYEVNSRSLIDRSNKFDRNRGSLIIYNSDLDNSYSVDKYAMNIDVLPTVLNLFGIEYDSRVIIGKDIMSSNNDGLVILSDRSWVNEYGAYDSSTGGFTPYVEGIDSKYVVQKTQEVNEKYQISVTMQYNDYYKYIFQ